MLLLLVSKIETSKPLMIKISVLEIGQNTWWVTVSQSMRIYQVAELLIKSAQLATSMLLQS